MSQQTEISRLVGEFTHRTNMRLVMKRSSDAELVSLSGTPEKLRSAVALARPRRKCELLVARRHVYVSGGPNLRVPVSRRVSLQCLEPIRSRVEGPELGS